MKIHQSSFIQPQPVWVSFFLSTKENILKNDGKQSMVTIDFHESE